MAQLLNAKDISDHKMLQTSSIISAKESKNFMDKWVSAGTKKARADDDIIIQRQDIGDLFDEMIGIDDAYEQSRVFS